MPEYITTYTGVRFTPTSPDPEGIRAEDIAHALSLICRGNGHVKTFFSVGQHCIRCAREALARGYSTRVALGCLLHDAGECYLSDIPSPVKPHFPEYFGYEDTILNLIYSRYLGSPPNSEEQSRIDEIDHDMLYYDLKILLNEIQDREAPVMQTNFDYTFVPFEQVEAEYLDLLKTLTAAMDR